MNFLGEVIHGGSVVPNTFQGKNNYNSGNFFFLGMHVLNLLVKKTWNPVHNIKKKNTNNATNICVSLVIQFLIYCVLHLRVFAVPQCEKQENPAARWALISGLPLPGAPSSAAHWSSDRNAAQTLESPRQLWRQWIKRSDSTDNYGKAGKARVTTITWADRMSEWIESMQQNRNVCV